MPSGRAETFVSPPLAVALDVVLIAGSVVGLWLGASLFVSNAAALARRVGLSDLVIGLTVVALGTSAPEAAVTVDAALTGRPAIAVANVVGSNIFNLGLVLGLVALVRALAPAATLVRRDGPVALVAAVLVAVFVRDGVVATGEGAILFACFLAYLWVLYAQSDRTAAVETEGGRATLLTPVLLVVGAVVIVVAANVLVTAAADLARLAGVSEWVIGETVVAVGTSTPELAASAVAARNGMGDIAAGNLVGSSIFNVLGILGLAAVVVPLPVGGEAFAGAGWLVVVSTLALVFFVTGDRLTAREGAALVALAVGRWLWDLL